MTLNQIALTHVLYVDAVKKGLNTVHTSSYNMKYIKAILCGIIVVGECKQGGHFSHSLPGFF